MRGAVLFAAVLTAVAFWVRWHASPGAWGADAIFYVDGIVHPPAIPDGRTERVIFMRIVGAALRFGDWAPAWASFPSAVLAAAVVPGLWFALRRQLGDHGAIAVAAMWIFQKADLRESSRVSNDGWITLPVALSCGALYRAAKDPARATRWMLLIGVALGLGVAVKETLVFALMGFPIAALCIGTGWTRWRNALILGGSGVLVLCAVMFVVNPARAGAVETITSAHPWQARWGTAAFTNRLAIEIPAMFLTSRDYFGLLFVVLLPLLVRIPFRALRGDAVAVAAGACTAVGIAMTVSLATWALLPAEPRYYLWLVPALVVASAEAFVDAPTSRLERIASLAAAALGLVFVGGSPMSVWFVPLGLAVAAWPALPAPARTVFPETGRTLIFAAVLCFATASGSDGWRGVTSEVWGTAAAITCAVAVAAFVARIRFGALPACVAAVAFAASVALTNCTWVSNAEWAIWSALPGNGVVYCDGYIAARVRFASMHARTDPARVVSVAPDAALPQLTGANDRIIARRGTPFETRCRNPESGLVEIDVDLASAALFAPVRR